jgi:ABC-type dipeptide/oligopeptide/nickel transport system permease component
MQGVIVVGAIIVILANVLTDVLVAYLNPKVSTDG